jgi:uncharacterized SAM-binding protein YcdF (DUF218 family)
MRLLRYAILLIIALALTFGVWFAWLCLRIDCYARVDLAQPADAIVVLGAKVLPDGQPGPDLRSRTEHAVDLYRAGLAPRLICAGGVSNDPYSAASVCRAFSLAEGIPAEGVYVADGSANTEEDAHQVAALMAQYGWQNAVVVSHPLHVYRAKVFFEREGLTVYTSPTTTQVDQIDLPLRGYYTVREGLGVLWPYLEQIGFPPEWTSTLEEWVYSGP